MVLFFHAILDFIHHRPRNTSPTVSKDFVVLSFRFSQLHHLALPATSLGRHFSVEHVFLVHFSWLIYRCRRRRYRQSCSRRQLCWSWCRRRAGTAVFCLAPRHRARSSAQLKTLSAHESWQRSISDAGWGWRVSRYRRFPRLGHWRHWSFNSASFLRRTCATVHMPFVRCYEECRYVERLSMFNQNFFNNGTIPPGSLSFFLSH